MNENTEIAGGIPSLDDNVKPAKPAPGTVIKQPVIKEVEMGELGARLALGIADPNGIFQKEISTRRWNLTKEGEIASKRRNTKGKGALSMYTWVTMLLSEMCTTLGPYQLDGMTEAEKLMAVNSFHLGDVLTAYSWLRREAMGKELRLRLECPSCEFQFPFPADLDTLVIRTADSIADTRWVYVPRDTFEVRGKPVENIEFGSMLWSALSQTKIELGASKTETIHASAYKINGEEIALTRDELGEMSKRDLETILDLIDRYSIGPNLAIDAKCRDQRCEYEFKTMIDWGYDSFFSISSP